MRRLTYVAFLVALAVFAACATGSTAIDDPGRVATIQVGRTTMQEVRSAFGEPDEAQVSASGEAVWTYHSVNRNQMGTLIAGVGAASGTVLGQIGGSKAYRFGSTQGALGSAVGGVVGGNAGAAADEKVHDNLKDQYRSLTISFSNGVVRDFTTYITRK